jgi:transposase
MPFFALNVFLKTPKRIAVMGMIMALCLSVYNLAQRQLRKTLSVQGETIPNQLGKQTVNPRQMSFSVFYGSSSSNN